MGTRLRLGLDLGGTKMEAVVLDSQDTICARHRSAMPADEDTGISLVIFFFLHALPCSHESTDRLDPDGPMARYRHNMASS